MECTTAVLMSSESAGGVVLPNSSPQVLSSTAKLSSQYPGRSVLQRSSRVIWMVDVMVGKSSKRDLEVRVKWRDSVCTHYKIVLPEPDCLEDMYLLSAWLECQVKKQAGVDPYTQVRFTSRQDVLAQACGGASMNLPINAVIFAGKRERDMGALHRERQRSSWLRLISLPLARSLVPGECTGDPTVASILLGGEDVGTCAGKPPRAASCHLYLKTAPGKNNSRMLLACAWPTLEQHPHILTVMLTAGPNLFVFSRPFLASTNALVWLHEQAPKVSTVSHRRLICRILLHVAEAVEHMHGQGCVHLDLKPDNLLIALKGAEQAGRTSAAGTAGEGLEQRLLCQVCDWELSSVSEGVCVKETRRAGGTPGYWSPEQVVELPLTNWLTSAGACNMQAVKAGAMSAYWRKPCLDPPPAAAGERVSRWSDSWGLATLLVGLTDSLASMRLLGFRAFRRSLCKSARRLPARSPVSKSAGNTSGASCGAGRNTLDALDLALQTGDPADIPSIWQGHDGACLAYIAAEGLRVCPTSRLPVAAAAQLLRSVVFATPPPPSEQSPACAVMPRHSEQLWMLQLRAGDALLLTGRLVEAEELCVRTLGDMVDGRANLSLVARAQAQLATALARQQRLEESLECFAAAEHAHAASAAGGSAARGADSNDTASFCRLAQVKANMGVTEERMGRTTQAIGYYSEALELYSNHLGKWHPRVASVLLALGGAYQRLGSWRAALARYKDAYLIFRTSLGASHLVLADVSNHIGSHFAQASRRESYVQAISWYEAALLLHLRCRTDDLKLAAQYRRIGEVYKKQGRLRMALQWCSRSLHIRMRMLGPTHCAQSCYNVAQIHLHLSNFDAALPLYVAAVNCHCEAARGGQVAGETLDVAAAFAEMALIYERKGQYDKAWELSLRAVDRRVCSHRQQHAHLSHQSQVDNLILKIQERLRTKKRLNKLYLTLRHRVTDWDPLWVPDQMAPLCNVCSSAFSILRRRHHCRMCGQVVCHSCSHHPRGKRICSACYRGDGALSRNMSMSQPNDLTQALDVVEHLDAPASSSASSRPVAPTFITSQATCLNSDWFGLSLSREKGRGEMQGQSVRQWLMGESEVDPAYCDDLPQLTIPDFTAENHLANHSVHALCYQIR